MTTKVEYKKSKITKILLLMTLVISIIAINNTSKVFADTTLTRTEQRLLKKVEKIINKEIKKKDTRSVEYTKKKQENKIIINIKLNSYAENKAYTIANDIIEKSDKKYSKDIDTYQFVFSSKNSEKEISFDYTRKDLNKVNIEKIKLDEFKKIATKLCDHNELPGYTVEKIGYSWFKGTKERTIFIVTRYDITNEERGKIAEQEVLKYLKDNKKENMVVTFYNSVASLNKENYVNPMKFTSSIDSLENMKIYKEINQDKKASTSTKTNTSTSNNNNVNSNNNSKDNKTSSTVNNNSNKNNTSSSSSVNSEHIGKRVYIANGNRYYHCISNCKYLEGAPTELITLTSSTEKFECNCWTNPVTYKKPSTSTNSSSSSSSSSSGGRTVYIASGNSYYHNSSSCKFLNGASTSAVGINNVGGKHACNCVKY